MLLLEEEEKKEDIQQVSRNFNNTEVAATQSSNMKESKRDWLFRVQVIYMTMIFSQIHVWECSLYVQ